jgi:2-polyprenyl-3-methyl-5-hydroxy-6-metoxy-1,4-benzoquinol methylase
MGKDHKKLNSLKKDWDDLAKIDPLWAIASDDTKSHGKWNPDEFFETGKNRVQKFFNIVNGSGVTFVPGTALDFGCGIGRLTQALAEKVDICYGIDISREMIDLARKNNRYGDRCKYILNERDDLQFSITPFLILLYRILSSSTCRQK